MARQRPWEALCGLAVAAGWDAVVTEAGNDEWVSRALRARSPEGRRVIALWRGRDLSSMRFTSACTWGAGAYFTALSSVELRGVLSER